MQKLCALPLLVVGIAASSGCTQCAGSRQGAMASDQSATSRQESTASPSAVTRPLLLEVTGDRSDALALVFPASFDPYDPQQHLVVIGGRGEMFDLATDGLENAALFDQHNEVLTRGRNVMDLYQSNVFSGARLLLLMETTRPVRINGSELPVTAQVAEPPPAEFVPWQLVRHHRQSANDVLVVKLHARNAAIADCPDWVTTGTDAHDDSFLALAVHCIAVDEHCAVTGALDADGKYQPQTAPHHLGQRELLACVTLAQLNNGVRPDNYRFTHIEVAGDFFALPLETAASLDDEVVATCLSGY